MTFPWAVSISSAIAVVLGLYAFIGVFDGPAPFEHPASDRATVPAASPTLVAQYNPCPGGKCK